jgi:pseudouridine-5'-phosphate glycosidase
MLSLVDCLAMCGLDEDEVEAIAKHENVPTIIAAELGNTLARNRDGASAIRGIGDVRIPAARKREERR